MSSLTKQRSVRFRRKPDLFTILAILLIGVIAVLVVLPMLQMVVRAFFPNGGFSLNVVSQVLELAGVWDTLRNTLVLVAVSGALALTIGSVFAWLNERTNARMSWVSDVLPMVPLLIPSVAISIGWVFLLSPKAGVINAGIRGLFGLDGEGPLDIFTWPGLIFLYTIELVPVAYLTVSAALRHLDSSLDEASRVSGRGPLATLFHVTLPGVKSALAGALLLVVVMGMAMFSVPSIIGSTARIDILSVRIVRLLTVEYPPRTDEAIVLSFVMLAVVGSTWLYQRRVQAAGRFAMIGGRGARVSESIELGVWRLPARILMWAYILIATVLPLAGLILVSSQPFWTSTINFDKLTFDAFENVFAAGSQTRDAIFNSVSLGILGATIGISIATVITVYLHRHSGPIAKVVDGITKLPGTLSHIVVAVGLLIFLSKAPYFLYGTLAILIIGYVIINLPTATISAASAANQVGRDLEEASIVSGATPGRTLRKISFPLMMPGLVAGWAILFVMIAGDLTASALLSAPRTPVAGAMILQLWENGTYPLIAAFALVMTLVSSVVVVTTLLLSRRAGIGRSKSPQTQPRNTLLSFGRRS